MPRVRRTPSATRCSAKCCTSARRRGTGRSCTARSVLHSSVSVRAACRVASAELAAHFERGGEPLTALRYYAEAAEAALAHLRPDESLAFAERGLSLLDQAPAGAERDALEFALATLCGASAFQVLGVGSEAKGAYERAYVLLDVVPQHPMLGRMLHGFGWLLCLRAEYADALAVAERAEALASVTENPVLQVTACTVQAQVHLLQGRPRACRRWVERALPSVASLDAAPEQGYAADPQVTLQGMLALQLLHLGLVIQAREVMNHAYERALELAQPMARMVAIWYDALLELRLGNAERVGALADQMGELVEKFSLAQGRTASRWFKGLGGRPPAQRARGSSLHPGGLHREHASRNARGHERDSRLCCRGARAGW